MGLMSNNYLPLMRNLFMCIYINRGNCAAHSFKVCIVWIMIQSNNHTLRAILLTVQKTLYIY